MARFMDEVVFPRMEQEFDRLAENMRKGTQATGKPGKLPKQGPGKQKHIHKPQPQTQKPRPNPAFTYYHLFEVQPTASMEVLAAAHRALAKKHHPDSHGPADMPEARMAATQMRMINVAWEVLRDPVKRREYDRKIGVR